MKHIILYILLLVLAIPTYSQQINPAKTKAQLASTYLRNKEFEKSGPLYLELYEETKMAHYFDNYISSLIGLKEYDQAIKELKKQIRKTKNPNLRISLGFVYKEMGDIEKSNETYDEIIQTLAKSKGVIINIGNAFYGKRELKYAEKTFLQGREVLEDEMFHSNLANIYYVMRDYQKMMIEYMSLVRQDEKRVSSVQSRLNSTLRYDFDGSLRTTIKNEIIKNIQEYPEVIAYNRLLIWFFVLEKDYAQALQNSVALDKRTKTEDANILNFAINSSSIGEYEVALSGLNYLITREPVATNLNAVKQQNAKIEYLRFINTPKEERISANQLISIFENVISELKYTKETSDLAKTYAHFLAFDNHTPDRAKEVLTQALTVRTLNNLQRSNLRVEMANIDVYNSNLWEATYQYTQIIDANKENPLGDEVKLMKAKVSYFLGDVQWARGQLDALKASTSKLIANDAMDLSLLISSNYDLDTIDEPIQLFAMGDLYLYQNKDSLAQVMYDSITSKYPNHSLSDKILMRKANISKREFDYETTASIYKTIMDEYSYSTSADDAMYKLALITETKFKEIEKAQELYKRILVEHPGSIFVADARNRYRFLRGDFTEDQIKPLYEDEDLMTP